MRMNTAIPMAGQQPDFMRNQLGAVQMAGAMKDMQRQNRLAELFQQHGPGIMQGDQNALNALGQVDPGMALEVSGRHQAMAIDQERLELARAEGARATQRLALDMDAATLAREREAAIRDLRVLGEAYATGNEKAFNDYASSREDLAGVNFENFPYAAAMIEGGLEVVDAATERHGPADSATEQKISRLMTDYGLDRRTAVGIADGVLSVSRDPLTGEATVIDKSTGQPWAGAAQPPVAEQPAVQQQPTASQESPRLQFGEPYQDAPNAFGMEGFARSTVNTVTDAMGFGPAFPETLQTQRDFDVLKEKLINDVASGYDRQPPSWLLKNIESLTPQSGRPFQGPDDATAKLRAIGRDLEGEREAAAKSLRRRMSPGEREAAEAKLANLDAAINRVATALAAFGTEGGGSNRTSSGVSWSIEE